LHSGPTFAAPFHAPGDPSQTPYTYARSHNPTWTELEAALAGLEHPDAQVRVFPSGMAAVAAVFGAVLRPGDTVVLPDNAYFAARVLLTGYFTAMGVTVRAVPTAELGEHLADVRLLWLETPSNPTLDIADIAALAKAAHAAGALLAVDNTTPTALGQSPLGLGADFSVASDSKSMTGHSDLLIGHVATLDAELMGKVDQHRTLHGAVLGPMEAWLALRSMATLPLRLERSCANALALAEFLNGRPEVVEVLYPGLPTHPGHAVAVRQMTYFGPVLSFTLGSQEAAEAFLSRAELVTEATSFGGVTTSAERRARWEHDRIHPGFIRLSAGCEHIDDLIADFTQALASLGERG
jgi:cystathionine gamma-lyase